jgi:DNA-directed RNA polymerase specialized sigma24 family protein
MNDPQLAAALRSRSPDALPELLDAHGDQLFSYCWRLLRNRENAQIAVRDALVVATAQIGRLVFDEWLRLWLYSLARAECLRREAVPASDADEPAALPNTDDADSRLTAWKAVTSMPADEVEALELYFRHDVDLRLVLGLSAAEVQALLDRAHRDLERALGAEILISKSHACPDRTALLSGWTGTTTPALRDRVLEHAVTCSVCSPNLPRSVSPARVFALLPAPVLSSVARLEVLEFFDDSRKAAYREFTVSRAEELTPSWFLSTPEASEPATGSWFIPAPKPTTPVIPLTVPLPAAQAPQRPPRPTATVRPARRRPRLSRIGVAAAACVAVTAVFALVGFHMTPSATTAGGPPSVAAEGPGSATAQPGGGAVAALPVKVKRSSGAPSSTEPLQQSAATKTGSLAVAAASQPGISSPSLPAQAGSPAKSASGPASSSAPSANGTLAVMPGRLDLGRSTTGQLTLTAMNGPVSWSADTSSTLVTLNSQQGTLQAGQSVTLTVSVTPGSGDEFVFVSSSPLTSGATAAPSAAPSASQAVEVTWTTGRPRGPGPSPSPSDSSSPSPSLSPSGSAAPSSALGGS